MAEGGAEAADALPSVALVAGSADAFPLASLGALAASSMASPPFGQKVHARHLHHLQWNFMNFSLQKAWHTAVGVSPLCGEMHWLSPCADTDDCTEAPPRLPLAVVCSRETFQLIMRAITQMTPVQMMMVFTGFLPPAAPSFFGVSLPLLDGSRSAVAKDGIAAPWWRL